MKKLISLGLVALCGITLASCGNSFEDSMTDKSEISSSKADNSSEKYKEIFIDLSDSFVSINSNMLINDTTAIDKSIDNSIKLSNKIKKQLKNEKEDVSKDLYKYASLINDLAMSVKNEKFDTSVEISVKIGESIGNISKNYFDGFIPGSINNMLDEQSNVEPKENTDSTKASDTTEHKETSSSSQDKPVDNNDNSSSSAVDIAPSTQNLPTQSGIDMFNEHANGMYEESSYAIESIGPKDGTRWDVLDIVVHDDIKNMTTSEKQAFVDLWASKVQGIGQSLLFDGDVNKKPSIEVHYKNGTMLAASGLDKDRFKLYDK